MKKYDNWTRSQLSEVHEGELAKINAHITDIIDLSSIHHSDVYGELLLALSPYAPLVPVPSPAGPRRLHGLQGDDVYIRVCVGEVDGTWFDFVGPTLAGCLASIREHLPVALDGWQKRQEALQDQRDYDETRRVSW